MSTNNPFSPSILFFIGVAIGVVIVMVFIFFSLRFYVRTKLGIYTTARLSVSPNHGALVLVNNELPLQPFTTHNHDFYHQIQSQGRIRRHFLKKRRLTEEEVNHLFPMSTYKEWLDGGAAREKHTRDTAEQLKKDNDNVLKFDQRHESRVQVGITQANIDEDNGASDEITQSMEEIDTPSTSNEIDEVDLGNPFHEIHFDSGSCAICIDTLEPVDKVRGLVCGHVFHQECLDPWLINRKACCPMCKREYYFKNNEAGEESENADAQGNLPFEFPELQYRTLSERVQDIVQRNSELEDVAKESIKHYLGWKWRMFWMLMGISKQDLINCAIVSEDERRSQAGANPESQEESGNADIHEQTRDPEAGLRERVERMV